MSGVLEALFVVVLVAASLDVVGLVRRRRPSRPAPVVTPWVRPQAPRPSGPATPVEGRVLFLQLDEEAGLVGLDLVEARSGTPSHVTGVVSSSTIGRWAAEAAARWVERGSDVRVEVLRSQVVLHADDSMLRLDLAPDDRRAA